MESPLSMSVAVIWPAMVAVRLSSMIVPAVRAAVIRGASLVPVTTMETSCVAVPPLPSETVTV